MHFVADAWGQRSLMVAPLTSSAVHVAFPVPPPLPPIQFHYRNHQSKGMAWGHAFACANLDDDEDQELIIGVRDDQKGTEHRRGVRIYDPVDASKGTWKRQIVDPGAVAVEDLIAADLDADGGNDIVAVGRQTHNVKIYWNALSNE